MGTVEAVGTPEARLWWKWNVRECAYSGQQIGEDTVKIIFRTTNLVAEGKGV